MRRVIGITAAWMTATLVAVAIAAAAVASVRTEVTDAPTALGVPAVAIGTTPPADPIEPLASSTTVVAQASPTIVDSFESIDTTSTTTPSETSSSSTTTTQGPQATTTSTTTLPTTSTTSAGYTKTYDTEAGSVRITVSGDSVTFAGATARPGWTFELESSGPEEVKVRFEHNDDDDEEIEFKAKVEHGELSVSISESDDD